MLCGCCLTSSTRGHHGPATPAEQRYRRLTYNNLCPNKQLQPRANSLPRHSPEQQHCCPHSRMTSCKKPSHISFRSSLHELQISAAARSSGLSKGSPGIMPKRFMVVAACWLCQYCGERMYACRCANTALFDARADASSKVTGFLA